MTNLKFNCCEFLDFSDNYNANKSVISSGNTTKVVWERKDYSGSLQLCQFCKRRGRINNPVGCLSEDAAQCSDYKEVEQFVKLEDNND